MVTVGDHGTAKISRASGMKSFVAVICKASIQLVAVYEETDTPTLFRRKVRQGIQ